MIGGQRLRGPIPAGKRTAAGLHPPHVAVLVATGLADAARRFDARRFGTTEIVPGAVGRKVQQQHLDGLQRQRQLVGLAAHRLCKCHEGVLRPRLALDLAGAGGHLRLQADVQLCQGQLGTLALGDIARHRQQLLHRAAAAQHRGHPHLPPAGSALEGGRLALKDAALPGPRPLQGGLHLHAVFAMPEVGPQEATADREVVDLHRQHAARVHRQQPGTEVEHFDTVGALLGDGIQDDQMPGSFGLGSFGLGSFVLNRYVLL